MTTTSTNLLDIILPFLFPIVVLSFIALSIWLVMTLLRRNNQAPSDKQRQRAASNTKSARRRSRDSAPAPLIQVRHVSTGQWEIQIQGQRYSSLEAVPDDVLRREVVQGLRALAAFARSYVKAAGTTKAASATKAAGAPQKKQQTEERPQQASAPQRPKPTTAQTSPDRRTADEGPSTPQRDQASRPSPSFRMLREPALKRHEAAPEFMPTIDLAREIGDIVAEMKTQNPDLANRSIRLYNSPGGGIYFAIDGETFENVEDIPDMQVQGLIRAATKEWERR